MNEDVSVEFEKRWKSMTEFAEVFSEFGKALAKSMNVELPPPKPEIVEDIKLVASKFYEMGWKDRSER